MSVNHSAMSCLVRRCTDLTDQTAFDFGGFLRAYAENMYALRNSLEYRRYAEFHDIDR